MSCKPLGDLGQVQSQILWVWVGLEMLHFQPGEAVLLVAGPYFEWLKTQTQPRLPATALGGQFQFGAY